MQWLIQEGSNSLVEVYVLFNLVLMIWNPPTS